MAPGESSPDRPGVAGVGGIPDEVVELARAGKDTQAISRLRQLTGASLLEAKQIVDRIV